MKYFNIYVKSLRRAKRKPLSDDDRAMLQSFILKYEKTIECKKNGPEVTSHKHAAWADIANKFNANSHSPDLSVKQLRKCWENMKCKIRKAKNVTGDGDLIQHVNNDEDTCTSHSTIQSENNEFVEIIPTDPLELSSPNTNEFMETSQEDPLDLLIPTSRRTTCNDFKNVTSSLLE